jgi:hypothetical protein
MKVVSNPKRYPTLTWKHRLMTDFPPFFFPLRSWCSVCSSHIRNSPGSDCASTRNRRLLDASTACMNSCGLTWL